MPTASLASSRIAATRAAQRYLLGTPGQIGNPYAGSPAAETDPGGFAVDGGLYGQRVCQFKGSDDLYAYHRNSFYHYDAASGDWNSVSTPVAANRFSMRAGPIVMPVNGVPTMVAFTSSTTGGATVHIITSTDGTTWNATSGLATSLTDADNFAWGELIVGSLLYLLVGDTTSGTTWLLGLNPAAGTVSQTNLITAGVARSNFFDHAQVVHNGRHYVLGSGTGNTERPAVYEFDGASFTLRWEPSTTSMATRVSGADAKWALFTDGSDMYVLANFDGDNTGVLNWHCYKLTESGGNLSEMDITSTVLPAGLRAPNAISQDEGWGVVVDLEANPGGVPEIYLYRRADGVAATPWQVYQWNGDSTLIGNAGAPDDVGGSAKDAMPFNVLGSGKVFWSSGELDIIIEGVAPALGGQTVSFRCYAGPTVLEHGSVTGGPFVVGETITGGTSGATAEVVSVGAAVLHVKNVSGGPFVNGETVTGGTSSASTPLTEDPSGGDQTVDVDFYWSVEGEAPQTAATLSGPSAGSLVGTQIQGLTADYDGTTLYTVKWETQTDSVVNGARAVLTAQASV